MYQQSHGRHGYVSIQGDPIDEDDTELIIRDSIENRLIGPNICCKIPTTAVGDASDGVLIPLGTPLNATEIFGVSQMVAICEAYQKASHKTGK